MDSHTSADSCIDRLLSHLNIHASGGPTHSQPLELFYPQHRFYPRQTIRLIPSEAARDGHAIVQDKDLVSVWKLPSMVAAYEVFFWEKAFEAALARETILIAVETFVQDDKPAGDWDVKTLLKRFSEFLEALGTKPVTITIQSLVDDMLETFQLASHASPELAAFTWVRSPDVRATLEAFIRTREYIFYLDGRMPVVEVTFGQSSCQRDDELMVEVHFTWNPPTVNFEGLQNVYDESRSFHLKPTMSRPCEDLDVTYEVDPAGSIVTWNASKGQFEGHCPTTLASIAGAERLEAFTMPLNMTAEFTTRLPGDMTFERTIRLAIPITIKRKPETCSSDHEIEESPTVRRPAVSVRIASTDTTPQSFTECSTARHVEKENISPEYKELSGLLRRKAKAGAEKDATAPSPNATKVQCWALDVDPSDISPEERTQVYAPPTQPSPTSISRATSLNRPTMPTTTRLPLRSTAGNRKRNPSPSDEVHGEKRKSPKNTSTTTPGGNGKGVDSVLSQPIFVDENEETEHPESIVRADSPFDVVYSSGYEDLALLRNTARELRDILQELKQIAGLQRRHEDRSQSVATSWNPPKNWRDAPERLNEAEKDALQLAIQEAHREDLREIEKQRMEKKKSEDEQLGDDIVTDCGEDASEGDDAFSDV